MSQKAKEPKQAYVQITIPKWSLQLHHATLRGEKFGVGDALRHAGAKFREKETSKCRGTYKVVGTRGFKLSLSRALSQSLKVSVFLVLD